MSSERDVAPRRVTQDYVLSPTATAIHALSCANKASYSGRS